MSIKLSWIFAELTPSRAIAGLVFVPLLAYAFQPFPEEFLSFPLRVVFWLGVIALALCVTWVTRRVMRKYLAETHFSARDVILVLVILALFVPPLWVLSWLLCAVGGLKTPGVLSVGSYGVLFATGLVLVRGPRRVELSEHQSAPAMPRLAKRLPSTFSGEVYRLTVRDHFVDVVTSEGTFTIRSRLTDAIAEMEPVVGHCTHRSHWVTDDSVTGSEKKGGKVFLRLVNDDLVPVSRKYKPKLEQDGVI